MNFKTRRAGWICAVSALAFPISAHADAQSGYFDREDIKQYDVTAYPEVDPKPILLKNFQVNPEVGFSAGYTDNLFATDGPETGASYIGFAPSLKFKSRWAKHALGVKLAVDHQKYADEASENRTNARFSAIGRFDLNPSSDLFVKVFSEDLTDARTSLSAIQNATEPNEYTRSGGRFGFEHEATRFSLRTSVEFASYDHDDAELPGDLFLDQDYRDRDELSGIARVAYAFERNWALYTEAKHIQGEFDAPNIFNAFNRDYHGTTLLLGSDFGFGNHVSGDIGIGVLTYSYDDPAFNDIEDLAFSGNVQWKLGGQTVLSASAVRGIIDPGIASTVAALESGASVRLSQGFSPKFSVDGEVGFNSYEFENIDRSDDRLDLTLGANWKLNSNIWLESDYEMRDSSSPVQEFTENRVMLRMRIFP